jgi:Na+-driven multidrug efflux pump
MITYRSDEAYPFISDSRVGKFLQNEGNNFIRVPAASLGSSSGILAAQNLGAGQPERAERGGWIAAGVFTAIMVIVAVVIWFWAENLIGIFNNEAGLIEIAAAFLRIQIIGYMVFGLVVTLSMCIDGVGDTFPSMIVTLVTMWLVQIPLAYYLPKETLKKYS